MRFKSKNTFLTLISLVSTLIITSCADQKNNPTGTLQKQGTNSDIVNGQDLNYKSEMARSIVFISSENSSGQSQICTGTFISKNYILTAAHCISKDIEAISVSFRGKDFDTTQNITDVPVKNAYKLKFPGFEVKRNDLGIIEFSGKLPTGAKIAELPSKRMVHDDGMFLKFIAIGYGRSTGIKPDDVMADTGEGQLRFKKMQSEAIKSELDIFRVDQNKNDGGVCFGDSGGPAVTRNTATGKYTVIGVASAVETSRQSPGIDVNDDCKNESLYLNMFFYAPHIQNFLNAENKEIYRQSDTIPSGTAR